MSYTKIAFCLVIFSIICCGEKEPLRYTNIPQALQKAAQVYRLDLRMMKTERTISPRIGELKNLDYLYIQDYTLLTTKNKKQILPLKIPGEITRLTKLKTLFLDGVDWDMIPENTSSLVSLETLIISCSIPAEPHKNKHSLDFSRYKKLQKLIVLSCGLRKLPRGIEKLQTLISLEFQHNKLATLPNSLELLTNLTYVNLTGNSCQGPHIFPTFSPSGPFIFPT